ncbi:hypothetical protein KY290_014063 [Solanum tuberosum]|uniref:Uncharacterized protein n=1 Tax=Solanum tuberosum TaxID=4113 RepID=A0ABQ7VNJ1_SOLTU|nr:hypothetical protein KY289_014161 [Solanum tuberosum]KAH0717460.1 hypothetical protein KY285_013491 [Solanum tuberosum]KAH0770082.1 hypothetical protein KY290_014063 [Solanum tuberosum]
MANQPHFVEPIVQPPFQQLSMHGHRSFGEGSSSQMHIDNSHRDYEVSDESSEEDEPPKDGDESEPDEDIDDIRDFSQNGLFNTLTMEHVTPRAYTLGGTGTRRPLLAPSEPLAWLS